MSSTAKSVAEPVFPKCVFVYVLFVVAECSSFLAIKADKVIDVAMFYNFQVLIAQIVDRDTS